MDLWHLGDRQKRPDVAKDLCVEMIVGFNRFVIGMVQFGKPSMFGVIPEYVKNFNEHPTIFGRQLGDGILWMVPREFTMPQSCFVSFS